MLLVNNTLKVFSHSLQDLDDHVRDNVVVLVSEPQPARRILFLLHQYGVFLYVFIT